MANPPPEDIKFLTTTARIILGGSSVATTTAARMVERGIDAKRLGQLIGSKGDDTLVGAFKFRLIAADLETPENFGVIIRAMPDVVPSGSVAKIRN